MNNAQKTLIENIQNEPYLNKDSRILFLNTIVDKDIERLPAGKKYIKNHWAPPHEFSTCHWPEKGELFDVVCVLVPKNNVEARYDIAKALQFLTKGGLLFCVADNKSGGGRLKKICTDFGLKDIQQESRNKAKCVRCRKVNVNQHIIDEALQQGQMHRVSETGYHSRPGLFGWNKIDTGSQMLMKHLPADLKGHVADFGCGYGYLSVEALKKCSDIKKLSYVDADARAIGAARQNISEFLSDNPDKHVTAEHFWHDLSKPHPNLKKLDFVIMNPPFHSGKETDTDLGKSMIATARQSLRKGGVLYMVANAHLPYEKLLRDLFENVETVIQQKGFKIFGAR
ncbi:MAG: methyltransferase [Alphaproteobacteria bacterium]|nr:methyltransferase [Alphaproteobacteria bacterium]